MTDDRQQQISDRAYRIWQDEGEPEGRDQAHWDQAERELGAGGGDAGSDDVEAEAPAAPTTSSSARATAAGTKPAN